MVTIVGSDLSTGDEIDWFYGGVEATLIEAEELVADASNNITLSKQAEFGSVFVVDADDNPTTAMLEMQADGTTPATEATGTHMVTCDAPAETYYAHYLDIATTDLVQVLACQDVDSPLAVDTRSTEVSGQVNKVQKTGSAARTISLGKVTYNDAFIAAIYGDSHSASPAAGQTKWTDKFSSTKKISALVGIQTVNGVVTRKYFFMGCQVVKLDDSFPAADFFTESMEFLVDYMVRVKL